MVTLLAGMASPCAPDSTARSSLLAALGVSGTLRALVCAVYTQSDVDALVAAVDRALEILVD